jgi:hypothetical protein
MSSPATDAGDRGELGGVPPLWQAESVETLLSHFPIAVVATVEAKDGEVQRPDILPGIPDSPVTYYRLRIDDAILPGNLKPGDEILLGQAGGTRRDGITTLTEGHPVVGKQYLFFLEELPPEHRIQTGDGEQYSHLGPIARFEIDARGHIVPTGYEAAPGIAAISGVTAEEVNEASAKPDKNAALAALATRTIEDVRPVIIEAASRTTPRPTASAAATTQRPATFDEAPTPPAP